VLSRPDDARGLFNHDANQVLGRVGAGTLKLALDATGLRYEIAPGDTSVARDVLEFVRRGEVSGSSFSFRLERGGQTWTTVTEGPDGYVDELREITDVAELFDVGPVTFPAYEGTSADLREQRAKDAEALRALRKAQGSERTVPTREHARRVLRLRQLEMEGTPIAY
jgi:hypothetical protein